MTWSLDQLNTVLAENENWLIHQEPGCLTVTNEDGLDAYVAVSGQQIIVESILFAKSQVGDTAALNEEILKTHQLFPLTSVGITRVHHEDYYCAFGSISSATDAPSLRVELETLFNNVSNFLEAYEQFIH